MTHYLTHLSDNLITRLRLRNDLVSACSDLENKTQLTDYIMGIRKFSGNGMDVTIKSGTQVNPGSKQWAIAPSAYGRVAVTLFTPDLKNTDIKEKYSQLKNIVDSYENKNN